MSWVFLIFAGCLEVFGILTMKKVASKKGKSFLLWLCVLLLGFACSLSLLSLAMREIDISVVYAVWTGIGAVGGVVMARIVYQEKITLLKGVCLFVIIASVVGLKLLG